MDELDGMTSDKHGISFLMKIIKKTKVPIICVSNDFSHQKLRNLARHCYSLKFEKPKRLLSNIWNHEEHE